MFVNACTRAKKCLNTHTHKHSLQTLRLNTIDRIFGLYFCSEGKVSWAVLSRAVTARTAASGQRKDLPLWREKQLLTCVNHYIPLIHCFQLPNIYQMMPTYLYNLFLRSICSFVTLILSFMANAIRTTFFFVISVHAVDRIAHVLNSFKKRL